jgi:hypothetical protein
MIDKTTSISKTALKDFYELRKVIEHIAGNEMNDRDNLMRADRRHELIDKGKAICNKWIDANPPII